MIADHSLISFIEDPFLITHVANLKKFQAKLKKSVDISLSAKLFANNLEQVKELTQFLQPESEDEEEPAETPESNAQEQPPEEEEKKEEVKEEKTKSAKKDAKKGGKKDKKEEVVEETKEDEKPDLNANKFVPEVLHLGRESFSNASAI